MTKYFFYLQTVMVCLLLVLKGSSKVTAKRRVDLKGWLYCLPAKTWTKENQLVLINF
jgi:hypothetical protein